MLPLVAEPFVKHQRQDVILVILPGGLAAQDVRRAPEVRFELLEREFHHMLPLANSNGSKDRQTARKKIKTIKYATSSMPDPPWRGLLCLILLLFARLWRLPRSYDATVSHLTVAFNSPLKPPWSVKHGVMVAFSLRLRATRRDPSEIAARAGKRCPGAPRIFLAVFFIGSTAFLQGLMGRERPPAGGAWAVHMSPRRTADSGSPKGVGAPVHLRCPQTSQAGEPRRPETLGKQQHKEVPARNFLPPR